MLGQLLRQRFDQPGVAPGQVGDAELRRLGGARIDDGATQIGAGKSGVGEGRVGQNRAVHAGTLEIGVRARSEEHTSELQSLMRLSYADLCLKKKKTNT